MASVHTYPTADLIEHDTESDDCPCGPTIEPVPRDDGSIGWHILHHSLDGRERFEQMAKRVCAEVGCPVLCDSTRCPAHTRARDKARGSRQARGYDAAHDAERARWQRKLDAGAVIPCHNPHCLTPEQPIDPRSWHLGHTPDRKTWRGPEHPICNLSEAGRAS